MSSPVAWWRHALLAGVAAGLLLASWVRAPPGWLLCTFALACAAAVAGRPLFRSRGPRPRAWAWLTTVVAVGALAGLGAGDARLAAIDRGAFAGPPGEATATGFVGAPARAGFGEFHFPLDTPDGTLLVVAPGAPPGLDVGGAVEVEGSVGRPEDPFEHGEAERVGARLVIRADEVVPTDGRRGGVAGILDGIRRRAERGLSDGMGAGEAALARGFVLGQDDLIDPGVREDFRRSGLAHLLAVSGQNVMLLAILAGVVMGLFGVGLRMRLALTLLLIAAYVPVAGGGASIQRAGIMGAAAIVATLAGRPIDRAYPALLAAAATLLIDPRFAGDVGWQLSFAAIIGIALWASPLRVLLAERFAGRLPERLAAPLAEGVALTIAATIATAPLLAHHFEELSLASLPANLLALPAVAPLMWIGMATGLIAQVPFLPTEPPAAVEEVLVRYVAAIAHALAEPGWAQVDAALSGPLFVLVAYVLIGLLLLAALATSARRRGLRQPPMLTLTASGLLLAALATMAWGGGSERAEGASDGLRITALDVGQGDATLLRPPRGDPVLVDAGPPGEAALDALEDLGVDRLAAAFVTHDDLDHAGGMPAVLSALEVRRLFTARPAPESAAAARAAGTRVLRTGEGGALRFGGLTIDVLWPPADASPAAPEERNLDSLVMRASFRGFDALLTGDAEFEATHLDPGPVDVLKVPHHGSDDAGLESMLDRSVPRVALIEVGEDNPYGHPTEDTLGALAERGICVLRTDVDGAATVEVGEGGVAAWTADGTVHRRPGCLAGG